MKKLFFVLAVFATACSSSCKKSSVEQVANQPSKPLVTGVGTANGTPVSQLVVAATGGTITSADGKISVTIPAGALAADEIITIQPITNPTGQSIGKNYRLTPHGLQFSSPVTINFHYEDAEISATKPEMLNIGYQAANGSWKAIKATAVDKVAKKLSVTTTHFSDWGIFPIVYISPAEARLGVNETVSLKVMFCLTKEDLEANPAPGSEADILEPKQILPQFIKQWNYNGTGSLTPNGSAALYKAPPTVPNTNPEAVSAEIKWRQNTFLLVVANITILSEFHIDYLQVDEREVNITNPPINYVSRLFIYGNFGNDPGANNRRVKLNNVDVIVMAWTPKVIICEIPAIGPASSGDVVVTSGGNTATKLLNEWTVDFNYAKRESPDGSLTRKTTFVLRFRGDAIGFGSGETAPMLEYTDLNKLSKAVIDMPVGSYSNTVSQDACGTYTVKWDALNHVTDRNLYGVSNTFAGRVYQDGTGFGVKIRYMSANVLRSTRTFAPCVGSATQNIVFEPISFDGYHEEVIWFPFANQSARTAIKAGAPAKLERTGVAPGLFWDAISLNPDLFYTKIWWAETTAKYN